ncbi:MAG: hypothetical protein JZD41_02165 [Thermoproteus sp.]|nr:hypothetical protein [Thermoproteus sp.]
MERIISYCCGEIKQIAKDVDVELKLVKKMPKIFLVYYGEKSTFIRLTDNLPRNFIFNSELNVSAFKKTLTEKTSIFIGHFVKYEFEKNRILEVKVFEDIETRNYFFITSIA